MKIDQSLSYRLISFKILLSAVLLCLLFYSPSIASRLPSLSIDQMLDKAALVVNATVLNIDKHNYDADKDEPKTTVTFLIDEVYFSQTDEKEISVILRGGFCENGVYEEWSTVPHFAVNESYILFFKNSEYYDHPFVVARHSILGSVVDENNEEHLVDQEGYSIKASNKHGLIITEKLAESMKELNAFKRFGNRLPVTFKEPLPGKEDGSEVMTHISSKADEIKDFIRARISVFREKMGQKKRTLRIRPTLQF